MAALGVFEAVTFARPLVLGGLPVAAALLWLLVFRHRKGRNPGRRTRTVLFAVRLFVVASLVIAAAGPSTVTTKTSVDDPHVTMLVDRSASMDVYRPVSDDLESAIENEGVTVNRVPIGGSNRSRIGEGLVATLRPNGSVLLVSDGQVTGGASLRRAAGLARSRNATINRVRLTTNRTDARVQVAGPAKVSVGVENRFVVRVAGVEQIPSGTSVTVSIDGDAVDSRKTPENGVYSVTHNFSSTGAHRVTARVDENEGYAVNDVYRKTVRVVEQPRVLYVSRGEYPLERYLRELYNVTRADSVPTDPEDYHAVVVQDVAAPDLGAVDSLERYVIDGNGLVMVGGEHAYDKGSYENSRVSSLLPVTVGGSRNRRTDIVLAVDVSGSAKEGMRTQKALALDVLSQLGDRNRVGLVAFNRNAYRVANRTSLADSRESLKRKIRSLESGGGTDIATGLLGASKMLGNDGGTVVLLSDGRGNSDSTFAAANRLSERNIRVVSVGVGNIDQRVLRGVAERTGGTYLPADSTNRLRVQFGGPNRRYGGEHAVVVDDGHFITQGVEPTASLSGVNEVGVKEGAQLLVATGDGAPALSSWRFGLGRVVAVTAYGADGSLGGLRSRPDSLLLSRSVNWAVGDPQRKAMGVVDAPDTRVGERTTIAYVGQRRPSIAGLSFSKVGPERYEARPKPETRGFRTVMDNAYAVNYQAEYAALGASPRLQDIVQRTGGRSFAPTQADAIASTVKQQTAHRRRVEQSWDWAFLVVALLVYTGEVCVRRLRRHRTGGVIA